MHSLWEPSQCFKWHSWERMVRRLVFMKGYSCVCCSHVCTQFNENHCFKLSSIYFFRWADTLPLSSIDLLKCYHLPTGRLSNVFCLLCYTHNSEEKALYHTAWQMMVQFPPPVKEPKLPLNCQHRPNHTKWWACSLWCQGMLPVHTVIEEVLFYSSDYFILAIISSQQSCRAKWVCVSYMI